MSSLFMSRCPSADAGQCKSEPSMKILVNAAGYALSEAAVDSAGRRLSPCAKSLILAHDDSEIMREKPTFYGRRPANGAQLRSAVIRRVKFSIGGRDHGHYTRQRSRPDSARRGHANPGLPALRMVARGVA